MANYAIVPRQEEAETEGEMKPSVGTKHEGKSSSSTSAAAKIIGTPPPGTPAGWTARGLPVGDIRVPTNEWGTSLLSCLGKNDEFYSSDLEVCVLGCCAPCVLHGSNVERVGSKPGPTTFATHCLPYTGLCMLGNCFFGWNCLAPWFSYPNRTAIRRKFNLEVSYFHPLPVSYLLDHLYFILTFSTYRTPQGSWEAMGESSSCLGNTSMNEAQREHCESVCDLATHVLCHPCALCQEARELRRKLPHPGFTAKPVIVMLPPGGQTMGR